MVENANNQLTVSELIYILFFSVMLFAKGMGLYDGQWPYTLSLVIGAILIVTNLLLSKHGIIEWIVIILLTAFGILIYIRTGETGALINIAVVIGMKDVYVKRVFKVGAFIWILTFIAQAALTLTGIKSDIFRVQSKLGLGYIFRWSLGYPHPNVLQVSMMILSAFILYHCDLKGKKLIKLSILLLLLNLYGFLYSISYTGLILCVLYLILNIYTSERNAFSIPEKVLMVLCVPACALFSVLGPNYIPEPLWSICNKLLNTRFYIARTYMEHMPLSLFGTGYCDELPGQLNNLDSSYVFALMHYGIIFFTLMVISYTALVIYLIKADKRKELAITLGLSIAAISEPFFVNSSFKNISLVFLGAFLFKLSENFNKVECTSSTSILKRIRSIGEKELSTERICTPLSQFWIKLKQEIQNNIRKLIICGLICAIIGAIAFILFNKIPPYYYTDMRNAQVDGLWTQYMTQLPNATLPDADDPGIIVGRFNGIIPTEFLIKVGNNAPKLEWLRGIVSSFIWSAFMGTMVYSGYLIWHNSKTVK